ncbi:MAG: cytochrome c1 [Pseudomonadota bacterium]
MLSKTSRRARPFWTTRTAVLTAAAVTGLAGVLATSPAHAAGESVVVPRQEWSFNGITGRFDKAQLQRGFQVYKEVCSSCHGLKFVYWRNLAEDGGPGLTEREVKALAAETAVQDGPNDEGEMFERPGLASDTIRSPYANEQEARLANGGAYPPDLSLITKARSVARPSLGFAPLNWVRDIFVGDESRGVDYTYKLLKGYPEEPPEGFKLGDGMYYNSVYPGNQIAMAAPLVDDIIEYAQSDVPTTVDQYAKDVSAFLAWTAEPKLEERKSLGLRVLLYLLVLSVLLYLAKRKLWSRVAGHD